MMNLSLKQLAFYYFFDILFLLLILFGESFLGIYIIGAFSLFFLGYSSSLDFSKVKEYKIEFLLWILFLVSLGLSSFFTNTISLSLNSLVFSFFSFSFFSFFLLLKKSIWNKKFFLLNIILSLLTLSILSFFLFLFPAVAEKIPSMNLIYSTYGHNHLGALLVLGMPLVWYFLFEYRRDKKKTIFFSFILIFLFINLLLSFGRVIMTLGLLQIAFFGFWGYKKYFYQSRFYQVLVLFLFIITLGVFLLKNYFSLALLVDGDFECPIYNYKNKICKNIKKEMRFYYWETSLKSFSDNFLFGYGPGSYSLISVKYKVRPDAGSSYAHNAFLQIFAESGVFAGSSFLMMMAYLFINSFGHVKKIFKSKFNKNKESVFILIGLASIYFDVLFDFDWSFIGVYNLSLLFIVFIIKDQKSKVLKARSFIVKFLFYLTLFLIILLTSLSLGVEYYVAKGNINKAVEFFPYFQSHFKLFLSSKDLNKTNKERINRIYRNHIYLYSKSNDYKINIDDNNIIKKVSPWNYYLFNSLKDLYEEDKEIAISNLLSIERLYDKAKTRGYKGNYLVDNGLASFSVKVGDDYLSSGDLKKAASMYSLAYKFHPWVFNNTYPGFLYKLKTDQDKVIFWKEMKIIPSDYFVKHGDLVAKNHRPLLKEALNNKDINMVVQVLDRMIEIAPWVVDELEFNELLKAQSLTNYFIENGDKSSTMKMLNVINKIGSYHGKFQLGNYFLLVGELDKAKKAYSSCNKEWLDVRKTEHLDCLFSLENISEVDINNYWVVSQIILNK